MSVQVVEDLVRVYIGATPPDLTASTIGTDIAYTIAEILGAVEEECSRLTAGAILGTATGAFLNLHAADRGLSRQDGETDDQLRVRCQTPPLAGTVAAILQALDAIVDGTVYLIELPRQGGFFNREHMFDRGSRMGAGRGVVIALIPASASALESVTDALRSKVSAGKLWLVEEYT